MSIGSPECRHILPGGRKCHQLALRGKPFCIHHCRTRNLVEANRARKHSISLPPLEDRHAVQMSIDVVLAALGAGKISRRTAGTYAYAIKIVSDNLAKMEQAPPPEPIEICRDERGDILAAEEPAKNLGAPGPSHLGTGDNLCPIDATALPSHGWETTSSEPTAAGCPILSAPSALRVGNEDPQPATNPDTVERSNADFTETRIDDLRITIASHEHDPEPPTQPTKTELSQKRRQIERYVKQQREALLYWSTLPPEQREKENPELVINCIQQNINKCEVQLKEIIKLQAPDPEVPDPPL